jgi:hypothetical protein
MHTNRISLARKIIVWLSSAVAFALLSGCESVTLTDLTPKSMAENPSHIYTFSLRVTPRANTVSGIVPRIVVDGRSFDMKKSALGEGIYDFEYQLPAGRDRLAYYYLVNYNIEANNVSTPQETYTRVETIQIVRRYVLSLEVNRGPVGSRISVLGRGFTPQDTISLNGTPARTQFESANALSFFVPAVETGRNYQVTVESPAGNSPVGTFRVDAGANADMSMPPSFGSAPTMVTAPAGGAPASVRVSPSSLTVRTGEEQNLNFSVPTAAPAGGTLIDVTTDIPDSVIMPEVIVPAGQTQVAVPVRGGRPGKGSLFLKGIGSGEITIPITVNAR